MDEKILDINSSSWDVGAARGDRWSTPVTREEIAAARHGEWTVYLTESKPVPRHWFPPDLRGLKVLALASGGGQQGPILTSAGAEVNVLDVSSGQLEYYVVPLIGKVKLEKLKPADIRMMCSRLAERISPQ